MGKRKQCTPKRASETYENHVWEGRRLATFPNEVQDVEDIRHDDKKRTKWGNGEVLVDDVLQAKLSDCCFYLKINRRGGDISELPLGAVLLEVEANAIPQCPEFWLYVSEQASKSFLYFEVDGRIQYYTVAGELNTEFYSALSRKFFTLKFEDFDGEDRRVRIWVYLAESECQRLRQKHHAPELQLVMCHFFQIALPEFYNSGCMTNHNVQDLYDAVKQYHHDTVIPVSVDVQHKDLKPELRPYQTEAVRWMLHRESQSHISGTQDDLHCLYTELRLQNGKCVYFNKSSGHIVLEKPLRKPMPTGGILADEMGLGKTVEILALILMNPRRDIPACTDLKQEDEEDDVCQVEMLEPLPIDEDDVKTSVNVIPESAQVFVDTDKKKVVSRTRKPRRNVSKKTKKSKRQKGKQKMTKGAAVQLKSKKSKRKVSQLRMLLQQWYNEALSGMDRKPIAQIKVSVHCLCGQERTEEKRVRCSVCARWQHQDCVNYVVGRSERYFCPQCWQNKAPVICGCSLIVTPNSICSQWVDEIHTHISNEDFKVLVYRGVHSMGFIQPYKLMEYDVVITTYETLRKELDFDINGAKQKTLRHEKRFVPPPSPLSCVSWWRICLDEAQMVEGACKAAEMVQRLPSVHRWAITGTPVQKTFQDLYGLLLFLGVDPYCELRWWQELLYKPYCHRDQAPLLNVMCQFMWRTQKRDVLLQMGVPELKEELIFLHFSPIEEFYYRCQHLSSSTEFKRKLLSANLDTPFDSMDRQILAKILAPLVQLRQACVHPHAVRRGAVHLVGSKDTMTMAEVLESMIKKTKTDCEEELRKHISSLNGMAGISLINEKYAEAVELYRQVLRISDEHNFLKTDALQKIHAMHNLAEVLRLHVDSVAPTLRDHQLLDEVKNLETDYMSKHKTLLECSEKTVKDSVAAIEEVQSDFHCSQNYWWTSALEQLARTGAMQELLNLIVMELDCQPLWLREKPSLASVLHHLQSWTQSIVQERKKILKDLKALQMVPCLELVNEALDCHLRVQYKNKKRVCKSCRHESLLKNYESYLFAVSKNQTKHTLVGEVLVLGQLNQGSWKPNYMEVVLKKVLSCARMRGLDSQFIEDGNTYFKWLDLMKKEFKNLRVLWRQIHDKVSAVDELNMSKLRLRLRLEDEPVPSSMRDPHNLRSMEPDNLAKIHIIELFQLDMYETKLYNEREISLSELKKKTGQFVYLQNLRKDNNLCNQPCPICQGELKDKWNVLECGHCFCLECVTTMLNQMNKNRTLIRCPVCRELTDHKNMSYIVIDEKYKQGEMCQDEISVRGSYSTKVEAIVRKILALKKQDPHVKALVFSLWDKVLDILETALVKNDITFTRIRAGARNKDSVKKFKLAKGDNHITALLLPVHLGSKGLNLTEATHVLLTEPILNPTDELQVLGRLHRIGQTRETFVHRFLIYNTIEERIHLAMQSGLDQWTTGKVTLRKFEELFVQDKL